MLSASSMQNAKRAATKNGYATNVNYKIQKSSEKLVVLKKGWLHKKSTPSKGISGLIEALVQGLSLGSTRWRNKWVLLCGVLDTDEDVYFDSEIGDNIDLSDLKQILFFVYDQRHSITGVNGTVSPAAMAASAKYAIKFTPGNPLESDNVKIFTAAELSREKVSKSKWKNGGLGRAVKSLFLGPPKYSSNSKNVIYGLSSNQSSNASDLAFVIICNGKKYYFSAQTGKESNEWIDLLKKAFDSAPVRSQYDHYPSKFNENQEIYGDYDDDYDEDIEGIVDDAESVYSHYSLRSSRSRSRQARSRSRASSSGSQARFNTDGSTYHGPEEDEIMQDVLDFVDGVMKQQKLLDISLNNLPVISNEELRYIFTNKAKFSSLISKMEQTHRPSLCVNPMQNWDDTYQKSVSEFTDVLRQNGGTSSFFSHALQQAEAIGSFKELATFFARKIVDKYHVKNSGRGGSRKNFDVDELPETFIYGDILFNMAGHYDMYKFGDANQAFDEISSMEKKVSNELVSIKSLQKIQTYVASAGADNDDLTDDRDGFSKSVRYEGSNVGVVHTALMCVIDYKGFKLVAYPTMPLDEAKTLIIALDSGVLPRLQNQPHSLIHQSLNRTSAAMNLKPHPPILPASLPSSVSNEVISCYSSRVEVHLTKQPTNRIYALNLAQMMPIDINYLVRSEGRDYSGRLRPEFVENYKIPLSCDAMRPALHKQNSSANIRKNSRNGFKVEQLAATQDDRDLIDACFNLVEVVIPQFVNKLDNLEILPIDSRGFTAELHKHGINCRYLGLIYTITRLPSVRQVCLVEMMARSIKSLCRQYLRRAVLHYREVEAAHVEEELKNIVVKLFQSSLGDDEGLRKLWSIDGLCGIFEKKFDLELEFEAISQIWRPALFQSLQYHCGVIFNPGLHYDFGKPKAVDRQDFISFDTRVAYPEVTLPAAKVTQLPEAMKSIFNLACHVNMQGPTNKFDTQAPMTAMQLNNYAKKCIENGQNFEATLYSAAALCLIPHDSTLSALIRLTFVEAKMYQIQSRSEACRYVVEQFSEISQVVSFHWGKDHPIHMTMLDKIVFWLSRLGQSDAAYEYLKKSLELALRILGRSHIVSAGYMTKAGYMLLDNSQSQEALNMFNQALNYFSDQRPNSEAVAENHYCIAECLMDLGNYEEALKHSKNAKNIREKLYESNYSYGKGYNSKTIDSYQQYAKILASTYAEYDGVVTEKMRKDLTSAISCYEKVFKYMKQQQQPSNAGFSSQDGSSVVEKHFVPSKQIMLLTLTRTIVDLKLRMASSGQKEIVRKLREQNSVQPEFIVREVIMKLIHLSPSVYLEEMLQRIDDGDPSGSQEMKTVLQIVERPDVYIS